jgi:MFS family permease
MTTLTDLAPSARPAAGTRHSGAIPDRQQRRSYGRGFWVVGYAFAVTMAFSTIPAPLYVLYQARDHFGALLVTVIFAAYAVGVMVSLFLAGHISDWLGRRRMVATREQGDERSFLLQRAQPAMTGLIDGSLSTLAPIFATVSAALGALS